MRGESGGGGDDPRRSSPQESGQLPEEGPAEQVPESERGGSHDQGPDRQRDDADANTGNPAAAGDDAEGP
jgi:hypothetical protein